MPDPDQSGDMDALVERFGEVQARFDELAMRLIRGRARCWRV